MSQTTENAKSLDQRMVALENDMAEFACHGAEAPSCEERLAQHVWDIAA